MGLSQLWRQDWNLGQGSQQGVAEHRRPAWWAKPLSGAETRGPLTPGVAGSCSPDEGGTDCGSHHGLGYVFPGLLPLDPELLSQAPSCIQDLPLSGAHSRCSVNTG